MNEKTSHPGMKWLIKIFISFLYIIIHVNGVKLPGACNSTQYYDPGAMECQSCPSNDTMVISEDGFSCTCPPQTISVSPVSCKPCDVTHMISADRQACVPRRCQTSAGKTQCRRCPKDYISVTQNFDGSPMKEVQCIKCARGYRTLNDVCIRCESCACAKHEMAVRGRCLPKKFVNDRPKYEQSKMHPNELLEAVKNEYFCTQNDHLACRTLASICVRSFYSADVAGPCRLWTESKLATPEGLPKLTIETTSSEKDPSEIGLSRGMEKVHFVSALYTSTGGLKVLDDPVHTSPCFLPLTVQIGKDFTYFVAGQRVDCKMDVSQLQTSLKETLAPLIHLNGELVALPIAIRKPTGDSVQRGPWPSSKFRRYFLVHHSSISTTTNFTNTIYMRTLIIRLRIERNKFKTPPLRLHISIEAQYATKSPLSTEVTTTLRVEQNLPSAGVLRGLEICGGVLGALLSLYALAQWRGNVRRGGIYLSLAPSLASAIADTLYFSAWFSTLHALAAEAGSLGLTLPLSKSEEHMVQMFVYSAVALKSIKVLWVNYKQCTCDIFLLDWSEYNPPLKETPVSGNADNWRVSIVAREWSRLQTKRRACPSHTVVLALIVLYFLRSWQSNFPENRSYSWAISTIAWWSAYTSIISIRWLLDKAIGPPTMALPRVCKSVGVSLLVFQEEFYAHYVHGRNDDSEARSLIGPLAACRVLCAPQLRTVYKQLSSPGFGRLGDKDSNKILLTKFLAAFFERALDGLSWVASERTVPERLLDVELVAREAGNTSALLYDSQEMSPSCFAVTWWCEEWTLGTFDAMIFGCVIIATAEAFYAALAVLIIWQLIKLIRSLFGNRNQIQKTDVEIPLFSS